MKTRIVCLKWDDEKRCFPTEVVGIMEATKDDFFSLCKNITSLASTGVIYKDTKTLIAREIAGIYKYEFQTLK